MSAPFSTGAENGRPSSPPGVIDTVGNAFVLLNRRPYLIWIPILVDLMIWTGLRVVAQDPLASLTIRSSDRLSDAADEVRHWLLETEIVNLTGLLIPSLMNGTGGDNVSSLELVARQVVDGAPALLLLAGSGVIALLLGMSYLTIVGRLVTDRPAWGVGLIRDCMYNATAAIGLSLVVVLLVVFMALPFAALAAGTYAVGVDPALLLALIGTMLVVWALLFFGFSLHALALGVSGPLNALRSSYRVVRANMLSVLGLGLIVFLIRTGIPVALQVFTESPWSIPFAIVANAYVATGLVAATMLYFRDRTADSIKLPATAPVTGASG